MFSISHFQDPVNAAAAMAEHVQRDVVPMKRAWYSFLFTHSPNQESSNSETCRVDEFRIMAVAFLRDLDAQEGLTLFGEDESMDFDDSPDAQDAAYLDVSIGYRQLAGTGLCLLVNRFACAPTEYPFVVIKSPLFISHGHRIISCLKNRHIDEDYTAKVAPAVFVEIKGVD